MTEIKYKRMARVDLIFSIILVLGVVMTMLVINLSQINSEFHRQRTFYNQEAKVLRPKRDKRETTAERDHKTKRKRGKQQGDNQRLRQTIGVTANNQYPLARSLSTFHEPIGFYFYVVHSMPTSRSSVPSPLKWSEVRWGDLAANWGRDTSFDDILQMSTELHSERGINSASTEGVMKRKLILHCLPKTASTTLRHSCMRETRRKCKALQVGNSPYGYQNISDFFRAVKECTNIDHFCVQGGSIEMDVMNFDDNEKSDREPYHFLHMVPFRKFDDWVDSAISHIFSIDGQCDRVDMMMDQCLGYRELYMELYTKSVLNLLIGMALRSNQNDFSFKDKHHILLYNYKDTQSIVSEVSNFFGMDPLRGTKLKYKEKSSYETCPNAISKKFHDCHDETLLRTTVITDFSAEKERRNANHKTMIKIVKLNREKGY